MGFADPELQARCTNGEWIPNAEEVEHYRAQIAQKGKDLDKELDNRGHAMAHCPLHDRDL